MNKVSMSEIVPLIKEVISGGGRFSFKVTGGSMFPLLIEGRDSVILEKVKTLKAGDIILYQRDDGNYVLHRIVKIKNGELYLCGDAQFVIEYPIRYDQVIAVAGAIIRKGETIKVTDPKYKFYTKVWCHSFKARPYILKAYGKLRKPFKK